MKYAFSLLFFLSCFSSCFLLSNEKLILKKNLSNGTIIKLYYAGGGATDSDIIWIKKITKEGEETWIGKIKDFSDSDKVVIKDDDPNHISLTFVNNKDFMGKPVVFRIDLNNRIKRDATSPFNEQE